MKKRVSPFTRVHVIYVAAVGLVCSIAIALLIANEPRLFFRFFRDGTIAFVLFQTLGLVAAAMGFRVAGMVTFSVDSAVYVASLLTLGTGPATLLVLGTLLCRGIFELFRRELVRRERRPVYITVAKLLFGPTVTALIVAGVGLAFDPYTRFGWAVDHSVVDSIWIYGVASLGVLLPQYAIVMTSYRLNGLSGRRMAREILGPGLLGEIAFMPLGFALAISFKGRDLPALGALSASFVIFLYIFRRMWISSERLREKAEELAVVEEAGRAAASTLDIEEVGRRIGMSLLSAIDSAAGVVLTVLRTDEPALHLVRAMRRSEKSALRAAVRDSLHLAESPGEPSCAPPPTVPDAAVSSVRLGPVLSAPLLGHDGSARGYLSVILRPGEQPSDRTRRLLNSLARPAAIALENWRLYNLATEDGLTGLYVRRYLEVRLQEEFARAERSTTSFCLLMIDVDNLKSVNDRHGHAAGDALLRAVAAALKDALRGMDVAARWGGDEFAVLLVGMEMDEAIGVANRLVESLRSREFDAGDVRLVPSASIGIAAHPVTGAVTPHELIAAADRALYEVKFSGRKGTVVAASVLKPTNER